METTVREPRLSLHDLGVTPPEPAAPFNKATLTSIPETDEVYVAVRNALLDGYAGVIFRGPPGTSKSWYAKEIALSISRDEPGSAAFVQFHPSYQYEDFMEGWVPNAAGGFELQPKTFLTLCAEAEENPEQMYVLVIDEISRSDAARVFGEALTYLETSKRGMQFSLASGTTTSVPKNVVIIGTMNPWDRGVDDIDVALLRRFAQIDMPPSASILDAMLTNNGVQRRLIDGVVQFFTVLQRNPNPMLHVGHAYFAHVRGAESLARVWDYQLHHHFRSVCRLEPEELKRLESMWAQIVVPLLAPQSAATDKGQAAVDQGEQPAALAPGEETGAAGQTEQPNAADKAP